jgi:two-component system chemotaxis sensor kinase CheA
VFRRFDMLSQIDKSKILLDNFIKMLDEMIASISGNLQKDIEFRAYNSLTEFTHLNSLKGPIIHLIRNSIDHGIEDIFDRLSLNKNRKGVIELKMYKDPKDYYIEVSDDGGNIDFKRIKTKAIEKNLLKPDDDNVSKQQLLKLIFLPEFSLKDRVTEISGRGVGLNVVKTEVEKLNGRIKVMMTEHKETRFTLIIPLAAEEGQINDVLEMSPDAHRA